MEYRRYSDAADFLEGAEKFFMEHESKYGLPYGLSLSLKRYPERIQQELYFAAIWEGTQPLLLAMMTPPHNLILAAEDPQMLGVFHLLARSLLPLGLPIPGLIGPKPIVAQFAPIWCKIAEGQAEVSSSLRCYELRQVIPPQPPPGKLRMAYAEDIPMLAGWMRAFNAETRQDGFPQDFIPIVAQKVEDGDYYLWVVGGVPVCLVGKGRPTRTGTNIGPVYTPLQFRKQGYASAAVAAVSQHLLDSGRKFITLFTNLSNPIANHIYQEVGFHPVCDFDEIHFAYLGKDQSV